jgi:aminomethyltransferase
MDDLYLYRLESEDYLLIVNAARVEADREWLQGCLREGSAASRGVEVRDASGRMGAIAVQGPAVVQFVDRGFRKASVAGTRVLVPSRLRKNQVAGFDFSGSTVWVARTGYTGEDGFEIVAPSPLLEGIYSICVEDGRPRGLVPCGLGARDTLRTEMGYPLYGHELDEQTTPIEAGLGGFVSLTKGPFNGREVLVRQKNEGPSKKCVAFRLDEGSAPPRRDYAVWSRGEGSVRIGTVVSGTQSPSLRIGIGLAYVKSESAGVGTQIDVEIRGRRTGATIVRKPIYKKAV